MFKFYIFILFIVISQISFSQTQKFNVGEHLIYDVIAEIPELNINGKVGTLESKIISITNMYGEECYHIRAVVYGDRWVNSLYELKDTFETWVSTETFETKKIMKFAKEGRWTNIESSSFTNDKGFYFKDYQRHPDGIFVETSQPAFDALSLVYYMRFVDKSKKGFSINWLEGAKIKENIGFTISEGGKKKSTLSILKIDTYRIKETKNYGTDAYVAKKYNQIPVDVTIAEMKISGYTFRVKGILKKHKE